MAEGFASRVPAEPGRQRARPLGRAGSWEILAVRGVAQAANATELWPRVRRRRTAAGCFRRASGASRRETAGAQVREKTGADGRTRTADLLITKKPKG